MTHKEDYAWCDIYCQGSSPETLWKSVWWGRSEVMEPPHCIWAQTIPNREYRIPSRAWSLKSSHFDGWGLGSLREGAGQVGTVTLLLLLEVLQSDFRPTPASPAWHDTFQSIPGSEHLDAGAASLDAGWNVSFITVFLLRLRWIKSLKCSPFDRFGL